MAKLLIVDDEKMITIALRRAISTLDHEIDTAPDGIEAIVKISETDYDLVVMDLLMPRMNGHDLMEWIRSNRPNLKFVVMTAYGEKELREQILNNGAADVLYKPFEDIFKTAQQLDKLLK